MLTRILSMGEAKAWRSPMTPGVSALVSLAVAIGALACRGEPRSPRRVDRIEQILAAVPDSAMRRRWQAASDSGRLPPLAKLHLPDSARLTRRPLPAAAARRQPPASVAPGSVADVRVRAGRPLRSYRGAFTLATVTAGRLAGQLEDGTALELLYKLPDSAALAVLQVGQYQLAIRDEVVNESRRREIILRRPSGATVLWYIADGGANPYRRRFEDLSLTLEQVAPDSGRRAPLRVALGASREVLRVGQRGTLRDAEGPVRVVVLSSFWTDAERTSGLVEGDRYHVVILGYRPAQ
jgi:hypothetical protein